ncbi:MAG TPA: hypothetical protein VFI33_11670 [Puia sp.]|nr:hypothetical protein [Puia sp.]
MRQLLIAFLMILFLSSCLKQSIVDAMIDDQNPGTRGGNHPGVATMTYMVNGNTVINSVNNPDQQSPNAYDLGCSKTAVGISGIVYTLDCVSTSGEFGFTFYTDSLKVGNYSLTGIYGDMFVLSYYGQDEFLHVPSDSISFNITSYSQGHISGNFSGRLTPMITAGNPNNTYGVPGSVLITKGSFKDVPVFY